MTEREATREMTFDEEYEILRVEANGLFAKEDECSEPPFANCVVRRALRCIRKLREEVQQYRAIGTVEELKSMKDNGAFSAFEMAQIIAKMNKLKEYEDIGTVSEFRELKEKATAKKPKNKYKTAYSWEGGYCPVCECGITARWDFCQKCGQYLDWSEGKE